MRKPFSAHDYYLRNKARIKKKTDAYRQVIRADPIAWAGYLAKARAYKRKKYGFKKIYKKRKVRVEGVLG